MGSNKMKNESDVKARVKKLFKEVAAQHGRLWWFMPSANGFGRAGIPDFVGHVNGCAFAVETKFGKGDLTAHQAKELEVFILAGGKAWIVRETNIDWFENEFAAWVSLCL
jgi:hypothetical protein